VSLATKHLNQTAMLWTASTTRDDDGEIQVNAGTAISVRWEDAKGTIQDGQGDNVRYDASAVVDEDIALEGVMYLGTESEYTNDSSPDLYRIVGVSKIPDVKGRNPRRVVLLARLSHTLPTLVS